MRAIPDPPTAARGAREAFGVELARAEITAPLFPDDAASLGFAFGHAGGNQAGDLDFARITALGEPPFDAAADGVAAGFDPALAALDGPTPVRCQAWRRIGKDLLDLGASGRPGLLRRQDRAGASADEGLGSLLPSPPWPRSSPRLRPAPDDAAARG